ncbi:MAG: hypothetical protein ACLPN5_03330 [Roseiarcus sp.]
MTPPLVFFLGGRDLEMAEIAALVAGQLGAEAVVDDALGWGARLSHFAARIEAVVAAGGRAAAVELIDDMPADWPARRALALIDHHGERAGGPSSLAQTFALLGLPASAWTRRMRLIEANDIDHLRGLFAAGASPEEAAAVRARDRAAQGITAAEEAAGAEAERAARPAFGGALQLIELPHRRMAAAMDPLALALWPALPEALVEAPGEIGYFGRGAGVLALDAAFPGGWRGGHLPENGFWGHAGRDGAPPPSREAALAALEAVYCVGR